MMIYYFCSKCHVNLSIIKSVIMLVYRFKVGFEEQDDFLREIELRADNTFEDFHQAILGNLGLDPGMLASFFICDHRYRKQKEIQLVETNASPMRSEDDVAGIGLSTSKPIMKESELKDFIDDPHQRLLFVYDYINQWTFFIELVKIQQGDKGIAYPHFRKLVGPIPRELTITPKEAPGVEIHEDFDYDEKEEEISGEDIAGFDQIESDGDYFNNEPGDLPEDPPDEK